MLKRVADWQRLTPEDQRVALQRSLEAARQSPGTFISVSNQITPPAAEGILRGVPIAVKDNVDALGFPTTAGTPALAGANPEGEAPVVTALRQVGAVTIGKTNLHELAFGATSNNATFGPVRHPRFADRVAGGSSGGSAAAVALGIDRDRHRWLDICARRDVRRSGLATDDRPLARRRCREPELDEGHDRGACGRGGGPHSGRRSGHR